MGIRRRSSWYLAGPVAGAAIGLLTLPLTTRVLGPADYGLLAVAVAFTGPAALVATVGVSFALGARWRVADGRERSSLVSTYLLFGLAAAGVWCAAAATAYVVAREHVSFLSDLPPVGVVLVLVAAAASPAWALAVEVATLEGRAEVFAATTVTQAVATAAVTLIALFGLDAGTTSLFAGLLAGSVVSVGFGLAVLRPYLKGPVDRSHGRLLSRRSFLLAQTVESSHGILERVLLARFAGIADLGLYAHSQRYQSLAGQAAKAVSRAVWPVSLDEARPAGGSFPTTAAAWRLLHVGLAALGVVLTCTGDFVISLLTNDKFTDAWVLLPLWFVVLLVQFSGKAEMAVVTVAGKTREAARLTILANALMLGTAVALIPVVGAYGAVLAFLVQATAYRVAVRILARRLAPVPFVDRGALVGSLVLLGAFAAKATVGDGVGASIGLLAMFEGVLLAASPGVVRAGAAATALGAARLRQAPGGP